MAYIKAITYYQPDRIVTNQELFLHYPDSNIEQVVKAMGVESRAWASEGETSSDLGVKAAEKLFSEYQISPNSIDFVIFCSQGMDYFMPSSSCIIQDRLGIPTSAGAFGCDLGCSGFVYGLGIAGSFIDSGFCKNVLLITGDTTSKYICPEDKNHLLFGDAASATIVSNEGFAKIGKFEYGTDGSGFDKIIIRNGSWRNKNLTDYEWSDENGGIHRDDWFYMDGEAVFNFTAERVPLLIENCLRINNISQDDIDYYVFHQANRYMMNTLRKLSQISKDRFFVDISDTGNTASSTVPIGLVKSMKNGTINQGMKVMVAGFGVGFSWASTVLSY